MGRSNTKKEFIHYEVLGVDRSATPAEIHKAYRLRARQVHPDKNPSDAGATKAFQRLQEAYEILSDPDKRSCYDVTGDSSDNFGVDSVRELIRAWFRPVTTEQIDEFIKNYRGSADERCDIAEFVRKRKGNVSTLFCHIIGSEASDLPRYEKLLNEIVSTGEAPAAYRKAVEESLPGLRAQAAKMAKGGKSARSRGGKAAIDMAALATQINARQTQRAWSSSIVAALESKYCPDVNADVAAPKGRKPGALEQAPSSRVKKRPAAATADDSRGRARKS